MCNGPCSFQIVSLTASYFSEFFYHCSCFQIEVTHQSYEVNADAILESTRGHLTRALAKLLTHRNQIKILAATMANDTTGIQWHRL